MVPYKIPQVRYTVDGNVYYLFNSILSREASSEVQEINSYLKY